MLFGFWCKECGGEILMSSPNELAAHREAQQHKIEEHGGVKMNVVIGTTDPGFNPHVIFAKHNDIVVEIRDWSEGLFSAYSFDTDEDFYFDTLTDAVLKANELIGEKI